MLDDDATGFGGIALAHDVRSQVEVGEMITAAEHGGGTVTRRLATTFYGGYAGCFTDFDGHPWEITYNPGCQLSDDGSLMLPDVGSPPEAVSSHGWGVGTLRYAHDPLQVGRLAAVRRIPR
jgi:hypothetical protein